MQDALVMDVLVILVDSVGVWDISHKVWHSSLEESSHSELDSLITGMVSIASLNIVDLPFVVFRISHELALEEDSVVQVKLLLDPVCALDLQSLTLYDGMCLSVSLGKA